MNFSTFFIDKLSGTSPELSMGTKRPLIGSYMFSDIIKVYEDETSKKTVLQSNSEINPKDETLPPTDNVIQVSADDLSELFQFINSFITSNPEMQSTESNYKIDSTEISKKQFVVDGEQLTQFINGLVNKISNNSEIISNNEQNDFYGKELSIVFKTDPGKITLNITPLKKVDTENPVVIDKMLGSLQSLISADKRDGNIAAINNLSKLFPSDETNGNDVNKNTEEIENVEDQLKQKLFYKAEVIQILVQGKNDWLKDNEEQTITNSAEKTPVVEFNYAKNFQSSELSPGNLVDISQNNKPYGNIGQNQFDNNESAFKILNGLQGEKIVNPYDISIKAATGENVIKPLNIFSQNNIDVNNLIKELNVKQVSININNQSVYEKKSEPVEFVSGKINPEKMLEKNGIDIKKTESNTGKLEVKPESNNEIKSDFQKAFNGLKNLEKEDLKFVIPSKGYKNSDSKPTVDESILTNESINEEHKVIVKVSAKQIIKIANENSVESTSINSTSTTTTGNNNVTAKNIMKDNTVKVTVGSEAAVNLNIKPTVKENTVSENKEVQGVETIRHDNDKQEKQTLRDTDFTRQENKDQSKYTAHETFKNTVTTGNNNVTAKNIMKDNTVKVTVGSEAAVNLNIKPTVKENTVSEKKEAQSVETIRHDNDKQEKQTLRDTDFTRQENKDQSKYTAHETFKNTVTTGNNNVTAKNIMKDNTVKVTVGSEAAVNLNIKPTVKENTVSENKEVQGVETIRHDNDKQEKQTLRDTDFTRQENKDQSKYTAHETFKNTVTTGNNNVTAKNIINDNTVNEKKEAQSVETIRHDNDKQEKQTLRDTDFTRQENKDQSKYTAHETFKNSVQQMQTSSIDFDTEKIKLFSDVKTMQETVKNIKTNDLIPEFSKLILQGEKQSMTFQLSPENLGKVKLSIEMVNNQIFTRIEVENENIKQFIQSNIEQLKHNLQQEGIKYSSVNISLADYDQRPTKSFVQKKKYNNHNDKEQMIEELVNAPHKKMGYNTYEYLA